MKDLYKKILTGLVSMVGLLGIFSGEFIISPTLLALQDFKCNMKHCMIVQSVFVRFYQEKIKTSTAVQLGSIFYVLQIV